MGHYAVTAFGADRPGIMAGFTWALIDSGGNLEDVSSTSLRGRFAMMMIVDTPGSPEDLRARLAEIAAPLGVAVTVHRVEEGRRERTPATHTLSVYGPHRLGIVAGISRVLSNRGANMTELTCRPRKEEEGEIYSMLADVAVPTGVNAAALETELGTAARDLGAEITFEPIKRRPAHSDTGRPEQTGSTP